MCVPLLFVQFLSILIFTFIFIASLLVHFTAKRNVINADEVMQLIHKQPTNNKQMTNGNQTTDKRLKGREKYKRRGKKHQLRNQSILVALFNYSPFDMC